MKLKPCPFCGEKVQLETLPDLLHIDLIARKETQHSGFLLHTYLIVCQKCVTTIAYDENLSIHEVETRWNTRTNTLPSQTDLGIPCDKCGGTDGWICQCNLVDTLKHYKEAIDAQR